MTTWRQSATRRRFALLTLTVLPSLYAARLMLSLMPHKGASVLEWITISLFFLLFCWISVGFWTALFGFAVTLRHSTRFFPTLNRQDGPIDNDARTAVLLPLFGEDMDRVTAGLGAVYESLRATGELDRFDFFLLSDTTSPDGWVAEEAAWLDFCRAHQATDHVFYRRRRSNVKRKSGNVADFCRRWGRLYRYMIVFDADSLMAGDTMVQMVRTMEGNADVGILQTLPQSVNRTSLIGRATQFNGALCGALFAAGLHWWQLGDAQYWGHNVIMRVEPFMKHCQVPRLPGRGPLSGDILSHDFVEAALMRRAGWGVWLACDLPGSFEETPPTLIDELKRDRRWCQGNLQHGRLVFSAGLVPLHRLLFLNGILSYGSALLWLLFLISSSLQATVAVLVPPTYFTGPGLFPQWPTWSPTRAMQLLAATALLLFLPKVLGLVAAVIGRKTRLFGGSGRMFTSALLETLLSALLAPLRMIYHSLYVTTTLLGWKVGWNVQTRDDLGTTWEDAFRAHWWCCLLGILWGGFMALINPGFFWWLSPVVVPLALTAPLSAITSKSSLGIAARRAGLFVTPQETEPDDVLCRLFEELRAPEGYRTLPLRSGQGFLRAVVDPKVCALHCSLILRHHFPTQKQLERRRELALQALERGPESLTNHQKLELLGDPEQLSFLHRSVWSLPPHRAAAWGLVHSYQTCNPVDAEKSNS